MKKISMICILSILFSFNLVFAQKLHKKSVPSLIINSFQREYPRAFDIEWKMDGDVYKVEFETGIRRHDHTIWYDNTGKKLRQKSEISKRDLPEKVLISIKNNFDGYRTSDLKAIQEAGKTIYTIELKRQYEEWKVSFDADGDIISKIPD